MARPKSHTPGVTARVLDYFKQRPGQHLNVYEVARDLDLRKEQIQWAVSQLKLRGIPGVESITRGQVYRYNSESVEKTATVTALPHIQVSNERVAKMIFEFVGRTKQDNIIVRDMDENLFVLTPLDV